MYMTLSVVKSAIRCLHNFERSEESLYHGANFPHILLGMMLMQATKDINNEDAICICYRIGGNMSNFQWLLAKTKTKLQLIREVLFADDVVIVAHTEKATWQSLSYIVETTRLFGREVSQ